MLENIPTTAASSCAVTDVNRAMPLWAFSIFLEQAPSRETDSQICDSEERGRPMKNASSRAWRIL